MDELNMDSIRVIEDFLLETIGEKRSDSSAPVYGGKVRLNELVDYLAEIPPEVTQIMFFKNFGSTAQNVMKLRVHHTKVRELMKDVAGG